MDTKDIIFRVGYVRNQANLSARELSLRLGMSGTYITQLEKGHMKLGVDKLLEILEICNFPIEQFFAPNFTTYKVDKELEDTIRKMNLSKKEYLLKFLNS